MLLNAWNIFVAILFVYTTWRHAVAVLAFAFSSTELTRRIGISSWIKLHTVWRYLRSLALIRVTYSPSTNEPEIKLLLGHAGGAKMLTFGETTKRQEILLFEE